MVTLKERWAQLKETQPNLRIRNAADQLGVSEVELLATQCGENVTRLRFDFEGIMSRIPELGFVMALSRNDDVVHERKGEYKNWSFNPHASLFVGEDIDLRIFPACWSSAYAVTEQAGGKPRYSIQFFAKNGMAVHKIYAQSLTKMDAYHKLIEDFKHDDQSPEQSVEPLPEKAAELPDADIDVEAFQEEWRNLKDTHDFFGMLRKYKVSRTQALRLAPAGDYAVKVENRAMRKMLEKVSERDQEIMVFVGNPGMIQIHTGKAKKLMEHGEWYNVLDPEFNLHVKEPSITDTWVVRKPTEDGVVTAIECFNSDGDQIVQFFGKRKPGIPELEGWRQIVAEVEAELKL